MADKINQFQRNDGYNPSVKCDNPIIKTYVHKQFVKKVGDTEDDFVLDEKPVLVDEINIQKRIDEEAKTTDLKYLLSVLLLRNGSITGDEPELNVKKGSYGDITNIQSSLENGVFITPDQIKSQLPDELQKLSVEELCNMSDEEILNYISSVRNKNTSSDSVSDDHVEVSQVSEESEGK